MVRGSISGRVNRFSVLQNVQPDSGVRSSSIKWPLRALSAMVKWAWPEAVHVTPLCALTSCKGHLHLGCVTVLVGIRSDWFLLTSLLFP